MVAERLGDRLGQRVIVDNQPGAGGIAAARSVLASPADGYTLALDTNGTAISVPLFNNLPFYPVRDFDPISALWKFDIAKTVNAATPYRTLGDFLKEAKASPGKLNVGTISVGSTQNLAAELLRSLSGDSFTLITYRTAPEAVIALLRNDIQLLVEYYATVKSGLEDGKLRVIATSGDKRSQMLPNVPTVAQAGVPGYAVTSWNALFAPAGTPLAGARREAQPSGARRDGAAQCQGPAARTRHRGPGRYAGTDRRPAQGRDREMGQGDRRRQNSEAVIGWRRSSCV